ncbi:pyridoxal-phosphate dependent enzyme [Spirosoma luteolum]
MDELERQLRDLVQPSPVELLPDPFGEPVPIRLFLKRDDQLHPLVSGNKWRKLLYNLLEARRQQCPTLLTFGGAFSNHLFATAAAGQVFGFRTIGIVRGDELASRPRNPTLAACEAAGMTLWFVSRAEYDQRHDAAWVARWQAAAGPCYVVPEGGTNELAIRGTAEGMTELVAQLGWAPDVVACAVGTGGTTAGLLRAAPAATRVLALPVLKGLEPDPVLLAGALWAPDFHFGGYARTTPELLTFIRGFEARTGIRLEQVYTGKLLYGIWQLARRGYFAPDARVVAIHTGGLQGRTPQLDA